MKKSLGLLAVLALTATTLVGCAAQPTEEDYKKWAEDNGYVLNPGQNGWVENPDYEGWAEDNGYSKLEALPAARLAGAAANDYSVASSGIVIAPSAGQAKLLDYLGRPDVRYVDLRDVSEGYLVGHIEGFESISYNKLVKNTGLFTETKVTDKVTGAVSYTFEANYTQSEAILEMLFPKNETLFVMCQGGARVVPFMWLLASLDYDMSRVYNVGGYNHVTDEYKVSTTDKVSATVNYDFSKLTPVA